MATRITGLATGLDIDSIIKETMQAYRTKIDVQGQKKDVLEIKQKLYRDVMSESKEFYNKYFDLADRGSLLLSSNYQAVKFSSSNEGALMVTGSSEASLSNYSISGNIGTPSKINVNSSEMEEGTKIRINGKAFEIVGKTKNEITSNLNKQLKNEGVNITVRYTSFASEIEGANKESFVFESKVLGANSRFTIETAVNESTESIFNSLGNDAGVDGKAAEIKGFTIQGIRDEAKSDGKILLKISDVEYEVQIEESHSDKNIIDLINSKISDSGFKAELDGTNFVFKSTAIGNSVTNPNITINDGNANVEFVPGIDPEKAKVVLTKDELKEKMININGNLFDGKIFENNVFNLSDEVLIEEEIGKLNKMFTEQGLSINISFENNNFIFESKVEGASQKIDISELSAGSTSKLSNTGEDARIVITDSKGGIYTHTGTSNTFTLDGATFKFTGAIPAEGIQVTGKTDVKDSVDKIKSFIEDYNKLVEKLNKLTTEKRDRSYNPLTEEQRKELSEKEVELWDERVERGQLYRDSDLMRINNSLKQSMRTIVSGSGLRLEDIGITPVSDYGGTANGTYVINEKELTEALEKNMEDVKNLFAKTKPTTAGLTDSEKYSQTGIMYRLKDILYNETISSTSMLSKKVGIEGTSTSYNNTLTRSIEEHERKIKDMERLFASKEQALYTKYASLESIMNKYNSQMAYLSQSLGLG